MKTIERKRVSELSASTLLEALELENEEKLGELAVLNVVGSAKAVELGGRRQRTAT